MRRFVVIFATLLLFSTVIGSEHGSPVTTAVAEPVPVPVLRVAEDSVSPLRVLAIGAGTVVGVIAANVISGGMITPMLAGASLAMPADAVVAAAPVAVPAAVAAVPAAAASVATPVVAATSATMMALHAGII